MTPAGCTAYLLSGQHVVTDRAHGQRGVVPFLLVMSATSAEIGSRTEYTMRKCTTRGCSGLPSESKPSMVASRGSRVGGRSDIVLPQVTLEVLQVNGPADAASR